MFSTKTAPKKSSRVSITLTDNAKTLPTCTPNLMPFHIAYTGTAPVSTFFRVQDANPLVGGSEVLPTESSDGSFGEMSTTKDVPDENAPDTTASAIASSSGPSSTPSNRDTQSRFVSAFRGRKIQGCKVDIPEGYTGVVFRSDGGEADRSRLNGNERKRGTAGRSKGRGTYKEEGRSTRRSTRNARSTAVDMMDVDDNAEDEGEEDEEDDPDPRKSLNIMGSSQFPSFVLWHQDNPVDTGKDEYIASIGEWMKIASVLHQVPS